MKSTSQVASWLSKLGSKIERIEALDGEVLIESWEVDDLPREFTGVAQMLLAAAQSYADEQRRDARVTFAAVGSGGVVGRCVSTHAPDADAAVLADLEASGSSGGLAAAALIQLLRHKENDQRQQHSATQRAMEALLRANEHLVRDRDKMASLLEALLTRVGNLPPVSAEESSDPEQVKAEAWAVAVDKLTDGAMTHVLPRLGQLLDESTKQTLAKRGRGRPRKDNRPNGKQA